jgi:hypothetical protein
MCIDCEIRMTKLRVEATRKALELERYEYIGQYGRQEPIVGNTFKEVGDQLAAIGYLMAQATQVALNTIRVPHETRRPATIQKVEREKK